LSGNKGGESFLKYVDYTIEELKQHLEDQFEYWMSWDNWGNYNVDNWDDNNPKTWRWQIDHIEAHSKFKYISMEDEDFKKCWALTNLRPFSAKENNKKGAK